MAENIEKKSRSSPERRDRERLIGFVFNQGISIREAANLLDIKLRTAYGIVAIFEKEGRMGTKKRTGRKPLFNQTSEQNIIEYIQRNNDATLEEIQSGCERLAQVWSYRAFADNYQ